MNVYCRLCGDFIMKTLVKMSNQAVCALCQRVMDGEELTAEAIEIYQRGKRQSLVVESVSLTAMPVPDAKKDRKFSFRSLGAGIVNALGLVKPEKETPQSVTIAKGKRRPRVFSSGQLDKIGNTSIGSMESINDLMTKEEK